MASKMIDLFSDSATQPTEAMRQVMAKAIVGDEQRGKDPTVNQLIERVCHLTGKEAGLFLPTGTMCNTIAVKVHTQPGDVVLVDQLSHLLLSEAGGAALVASVQLQEIPTNNGIFDSAALIADNTTPSISTPPRRLLCLEQTHNFGGGTVWDWQQYHAVCETARDAGLAIHLDGARLLNAVVASGVQADTWCRPVDSAFIDFSKGLGAPFGAVLVGSSAFIAAARRYKQALGGAMRQAGIMAAACLYALDHNIDRLSQDHFNARLLAEELSGISGINVLTPIPDTNMVFVDPSPSMISARDLAARLEQNGVVASVFGNRVRLVTHLGVDEADCRHAVEVVQQVVESVTASAR